MPRPLLLPFKLRRFRAPTRPFPPVLRGSVADVSFGVPAATATVDTVVPGLLVEIPVAISTATVAAVAPSLAVSLSIPAATATVSAVAPSSATSLPVTAASGTVSATASLAVELPVSPALVSVEAVRPLLVVSADITIPVPATLVTVEAVAPDVISGLEAVAVGGFQPLSLGPSPRPKRNIVITVYPAFAWVEAIRPTIHIDLEDLHAEIDDFRARAELLALL
jgi:hypothetical protein